MSSLEGPVCRFYEVDPATAEPSLAFSTNTPEDFDTLAPADTGYTVRSTPTGTTSIPGAITMDRRTGTVFAAGATDIEYADNADTTAPSAVFAVSDTGWMNIAAASGQSFSVPLASQGITTGTGVGLARVDEDLYFTSGVGQPGALYAFDPNTGGASLVTTQLEESPSSLEYCEATGLLYYANVIDFTDMFIDTALRAYDPVADTSALIDPELETLFGNFAIDPDGRFAFVAVDDRIDLVPLDTAAPLTRVVFADNLPMNRRGDHDLVFGPSSDGLGNTSLYVSVNGRQDPAPPQILEFPYAPTIDLSPCSPADLAAPFGVLDLDDIDAFIVAFGTSDAAADIAEPFGVLDLDDIDTFILAFLGGCP